MVGNTGFGTSIILIAVGAILAFGVNLNTTGVDINTIGAILMVIGILGLLLSMLFFMDWGTLNRREPPATYSTGHTHVHDEPTRYVTTERVYRETPAPPQTHTEVQITREREPEEPAGHTHSH
jgi:hypothetical protein